MKQCEEDYEACSDADREKLGRYLDCLDETSTCEDSDAFVDAIRECQEIRDSAGCEVAD